MSAIFDEIRSFLNRGLIGGGKNLLLGNRYKFFINSHDDLVIVSSKMDRDRGVVLLKKDIPMLINFLQDHLKDSNNE